MQKTLNMSIVKNALEPENKDYKLKCVSVLAWEGAEFADGEKASAEMITALADSVEFETYQPPLLLDHDWDVNKIVGLMTAIRNEDNRLIAEFDVMSESAGRKIERGEWKNISLTFERKDDGKLKVLECSLVAIPQIAGARIKPVTSTNEEATDKEVKETEEVKEEVKAEEKGDSAEKTEVVKIEETEEEKMQNACKENACKENACKENGCDEEREEMSKIVANVKRIEKENAVLNAKIRKLEQAALTREKEIVVNGYLSKWIADGKTAPAVSATEKALLMTFSQDQLEKYVIVKNDSKGAIFGRLSAPPELSEDKIKFERMEASYNELYGKEAK